MKRKYLTVLPVILTLTVASTQVFAASQGASDLNINKHEKGSFAVTNDDAELSTGFFDSYDLTNTPLLAMTGGAVTAKDAIVEDREEEMSVEEIGELMTNPFSYLWFGMIQNDTYWWDGDLLDATGEDTKVMNTTVIQPVIATQLTDNWKAIFRPVIPINSFDTIAGFDIIEDESEGSLTSTDWDRETGLGDILLWTAFTNNYKPPFVWGFGPTIMMDTASDDTLGTGKWSAGPMALATYVTDKWIVGGVAQHWWSFAGDSDRDDVSLTDFQPIVRYRLSPQTNIGTAPNIQYNWTADSGEQLRLPVGGGISTVVMLGRLPVAIGVEYYYMVETPDTFGPEHQIRFVFTPVLPSPEWSRKPLFQKKYPDNVPEKNWVQTKPGIGWFAYLRLYGPEKAYFDKTWVPGDAEKMQ